MTWRVDEQIQPDGSVHVWPQRDTREHELGAECWCSPEVERYSNGASLVSHQRTLRIAP